MAASCLACKCLQRPLPSVSHLAARLPCQTAAGLPFKMQRHQACSIAMLRSFALGLQPRMATCPRARRCRPSSNAMSPQIAAYSSRRLRTLKTTKCVIIHPIQSTPAQQQSLATESAQLGLLCAAAAGREQASPLIFSSPVSHATTWMWGSSSTQKRWP